MPTWRQGYNLGQSGDMAHTGYNPHPANELVPKVPLNDVLCFTKTSMNHKGVPYKCVMELIAVGD
jgi:hypothetical protein